MKSMALQPYSRPKGPREACQIVPGPLYWPTITNAQRFATGSAMTDQTCTIDVRVRYAETDPMGVLHHSRYAVFLEMGRTELLRKDGVDYRDLEAAGVFFVVTHLEVRFRSPARYDDVLAITTRIERVGAARIDHAYTITERAGGRRVAEAATTLACVDADGRVQAIPADLLGRMGGRTTSTR